MDIQDQKYIKFKFDSEELAELRALAVSLGFADVKSAILANDRPVVAYMHNGENRFDIVHVKIKEVWDKAKKNHLEHYTIPLVKKGELP